MPEQHYYFWLVCFAVSLALSATGLLLIVYRRGGSRGLVWWLWACCSALLVAAMGAEGLTRINHWLPVPWGWPVGGGGLAVFGAALLWLGRRFPNSSRAISAAMTSLNLLTCCWAYACFYSTVVGPSGDLSSLAPETPAQRQKVASVVAMTDSGGEIKLFDVALPNDDSDAEFLAQHMARHNEQFGRRVIETAPSDDSFNCHGWVFTGGRYLIQGADVERILQENRYRTTDQPLAGDLVVIRENNLVMHTAIVRVVEHDLVLIEGKWGRGPRYVHRPEDQPYGLDIAFYHSPREGHLLRFEERTELNEIPPARSPAGSLITPMDATVTPRAASPSRRPLPRSPGFGARSTAAALALRRRCG